ncbi:MAG: butyrate kinase, partial [Clostridia bacterium]
MGILSILVVNPGSTSTKIAIYQNDQQMLEKVLYHSTEKIRQYPHIIQQHEFRMQEIMKELQNNKIELSSLSAIVGRGGLLKPLQSGTYLISKIMVEELQLGKYGEHASNLGAIIASELANNLKIPAYIVDPVVVDEMEPIARISGMPEIQRKSIFHALNQKAVARKAAAEL